MDQPGKHMIDLVFNWDFDNDFIETIERQKRNTSHWGGIMFSLTLLFAATFAGGGLLAGFMLIDGFVLGVITSLILDVFGKSGYKYTSREFKQTEVIDAKLD